MIPAAIALALAAAVIHGTWNVLVKVSGDPMATFQRATIAAAILVTPPTAVAWFLLGRPGISMGAAGWCALSAALELTYLWLLAAAYRRGELSVVYPIARGSAPLLAVIVGLGLLGEKLTPPQLVGVGLLLLGILAVTLPQTSGRAATVPALLTGVAIASYTAVDRVGVRLSTPWLYGWLLVVLIAVSVPVSLWIASKIFPGRKAVSEKEAPPPLSRRKAFLIGAFMWGGYLLVLWALSLAPLSVVAPVRETSVVGVAVWGVWRLRESRGAAMKVSGAIATLAGVSLLAL